MLDAFALAICAGGGAPAYPGQPGARVDEPAPRQHATEIGHAIALLLQLVPDACSYVSESDCFERDWQRSFWGTNHARLQQVKQRHDPQSLFFVHTASAAKPGAMAASRRATNAPKKKPHAA